ncbi:MAG: Nodulation protein N [Alphaproteobacteria bacterium TMED87]|nr:Nodulation protein N [Rhodospirillaceae bacterium]OUV11589.1 MAG: Nodulation protein N [Alphaproteobacteria bacterium TMED87]|tara:strand:- start:1030 stop:1488 length:459 start_codon:yes stop_codon:yes gene_type:complete
MTKISVNKLPTLIGKDLGCSDWLSIDQDRINLFADCTEDHQFIHIDEDRAKKETPFGGTIAHGFLSLSLLSKLSNGVAVELENVKMAINYGFEKIRFIQPVPSGSKVRAHFFLNNADERKPNQWMLTYDISVEIEGSDKPVLSAQWLTIQLL